MSEADYSQEFSPNPPEKAKAKTSRVHKEEPKSQRKSSHQSTGDLISIDNFDPKETKRKVNSPRTLEACKLEGILPKELLHIPVDKFREPGLPDAVAELRYEFHENKRVELIDLITKSRQKIIDDLDRSTYDHPTMAGSTQYQTSNGKFLSGRSIQTSKSSRSKMSMKSTALVGDAINKDKEITKKQMELIKRIKEKEQKRFEKYLINEERKNKLIEEKESRFELIRKTEKKRNDQIKKIIKEENEKKMVEEITQEKEETQREKEEKKEAWLNFIKNLEEQKKQEAQAEKERLKKEQELKEKEQERLEKVQRCEEQQQKQLEENAKKMEEVNKKYEEQMKKMKEYQIHKKKEAKQRAIEKRQRIQQIIKAKEEQEQKDLIRFLDKQQRDFERDMTLKKEKNKSLKDIRKHAEEKNKQKDRILSQAEHRMQKKIDMWLDKQKEADQRLEKLKEQEKMKDLIRKEFITLNNQSKFFNKKRFQRKMKYQEDKMRQKLAMEDMKIEAMADQRNELKNVRTKALSDMEKQRQDIKNALYHMTVWNSFSPKVVEKICNSKNATKKQTIEEMVRVHAAKENIRKRHKGHRRSGSALNLRPIKDDPTPKSHKKAKKANREYASQPRVTEPDEIDDEAE